MKAKFIFYIVWVLLLALAPITVFSVTPLSLVKDSPAGIANVAQRIIGLWAYTLLFVQIILGAYMNRWIEKFGAWIFNFHVFEGILIYILIILHPLAFTFFYYFIGKGFDPFYTFVDVCILCGKPTEYYYNFGRVAFWLFTVGVIAGLFRGATPFLRMHWHKLHILNYLAFFFVFVHSLFLGSDMGVRPFWFVHAFFAVTVLVIVIFKLNILRKKYTKSTPMKIEFVNPTTKKTT
jgi:predicted ferric reductase